MSEPPLGEPRDDALAPPAEEGPVGEVAFRDKAVSAVVWNTGFGIFRDLLQFATMIVLVRLVAPEAYGRFAVAQGALGFLSVFSFVSFVAHTLQVRRDEETHYQQHFTFGAGVQAGLFVLTNVVAIALRGSDTYGPVAPLLHVLSLTFLLEWPCELRRKMIERQLDWKRLRLLHAAGLLAAALLAVAMGLSGAGVYALVVPGLLATVPFIWDLFGPAGWRPTWERPTARYRPALRFGAARVASGVTARGRQLAESAGLARLVGYETLGFFGRATGLAQLTCANAASQLMYALYPVLTRIEEGSERYRRASGLVLRAVSWVVVPTVVLFAVLARPVVDLIYGPRWTAVIPLLPWAMAAGGGAALLQVAYQLLLAHNAERRCLVLDLIVLVGTLAALVLVPARGLLFFLAAKTVLHLGALGLALVWLARLRAASAGGVARAFLPAASAAAAGFAACRLAVGGSVGSSWVTAGAWLALFLLVYVALLRVLFRGPFAELIRYLPYGGRLSRLMRLGEGP